MAEATSMRERGFSILAYGLLALAVLGALGGIIWWADANIATSAGVRKGEAQVMAKWQEANRKAEEAAAVLAAERTLEGRKAVIALQQAEKEARTNAERWKQARIVLRDVPLAVCPDAQPSSPSAATAVVEGRSQPRGPLLTYGFLRQYDGAWTSSAGQPVFGDPARPPEGSPPPSAPSARGLDEALDAHGENARRCSENARQLGKLIALIERLRSGWR